jgi:hypothetical protein
MIPVMLPSTTRASVPAPRNSSSVKERSFDLARPAAKCFGKRSQSGNRRGAVRIASRREVQLCPLSAGRPRRKLLKARLVDVSGGGFCVLVKSPLAVGRVVRCEVEAIGFPAPVPTLMQVRWTRQEKNGSYRCGLLYLV